MNVSEISNVSSYQGQGSQPNTATVSQAPKVAPVSESVDNIKITSADPREKNSSAKGGEDKEKDSNQPSMSFLKDAVEKINSSTESCEAVYGFHDKTNRVTIKMVDKETKETIKEFPAEETLDLIAKAWELAGILVDEKR